MKIALFAGHNLVARSFTRLLLTSALPPAAIFRPTFAGPGQAPASLRDNALALRVDGATIADIKSRTSFHSDDEQGPPQIHAGALDQQVEQQLAKLNPELIVSVCYPHKLPQSILSLASLGGLNLHPSPLPAWRGNDPVFWQLRAGCSAIGLSWHRMTEVFDAGVVVARDRIALHNVESAQSLDREIAQRGAALLTEMLGRGGTDFLRPSDLHCVVRGRYFTRPIDQDYRVWTRWSTAHVRRFVGLMQSRGIRFQVQTSNCQFTVSRLFDEETDPASDRVVVDMADGVVAFMK